MSSSRDTELEGLKFYEESWLKEHEARKAAEERARLAEAEAHTLRADRDRLQEQVSTLEALNHDLRACKRMATELKQNLQSLESRITHAAFWRLDVVEPLAHELEALGKLFDQAGFRLEVRQGWRTCLDAWHTELLELVASLARGEGDEVLAERARRLILAQWMFVRWLEITNLFRVDE